MMFKKYDHVIFDSKQICHFDNNAYGVIEKLSVLSTCCHTFKFKKRKKLTEKHTIRPTRSFMLKCKNIYVSIDEYDRI